MGATVFELRKRETSEAIAEAIDKLIFLDSRSHWDEIKEAIRESSGLGSEDWVDPDRISEVLHGQAKAALSPLMALGYLNPEVLSLYSLVSIIKLLRGDSHFNYGHDRGHEWRKYAPRGPEKGREWGTWSFFEDEKWG